MDWRLVKDEKEASTGLRRSRPGRSSNDLDMFRDEKEGRMYNFRVNEMIQLFENFISSIKEWTRPACDV